MANSKNKKIAEKAEASTRTIKRETERISETDIHVNALNKETREMESHSGALLSGLMATKTYDYDLFNDSQVDDLRKLMNIAEALSRKIGEVVS